MDTHPESQQPKSYRFVYRMQSFPQPVEKPVDDTHGPMTPEEPEE